MKLRKAIVATSSLALIAGLAACSSDSTSGGEDGYVVANNSEPQNPLIPANTNETSGGKMIDLLYAGLVYYDAEGTPHNDMAESIELEGDKTYKVVLKDGITFADGSPVKAENFVKAWNYAVENNQLAAQFFEPILGYAEGVKELEGLKVIDDKTFTIELKAPQSEFTLQLGHTAFYPLPDEAFDDMATFGEKPNGNGPYKLESWDHNSQAILVPNENYKGDRKAENSGIKFVFYPSQDAAYSDLLSNNLDVLDAVPDSAFSTFESELGDRAVNQPAAIYQGFTIPSKLEHFSGEEGQLRRQAIAMAINREEITKTIFQGTRTPATDFTSPVVAGYNDKIPGAEVLAYNPDKAKELWAKADAISPFTGEFSIGYNADGGHQAWVDAVANQIKNTLGIDAVGNPYPDFKSLRDDIHSRTIQGAFRTGWQADYPSQGSFLISVYHTGAGSNDGDYSNPKVDDLLRKAQEAKTPEEAQEFYTQVQEILLTELPGIPLWYSNVTGGYSENVSNVTYGWNSVPQYYKITKK
ncbi:ABC transporter substrate-binding protein [Corynebacterium sp. sy017]|uniref:peptide ABC transporter substrate-binding protein n=1 Tax=unclassified Corynebacterium TaxID=2624378 RepID=UPI0011858F95|nr:MULTISPECIES: ABC transporter substrate-binding protein [unclassified Corynebacterium]MBP3088939.1 ABC transporter substrate-binding protein [Corynebacterium sp. sy017]QDZ42315.1 ABC transporter substrate-binding protein [Corynebacterium sp. sy039]TSD91267.1 ABC transporter substrate-binding protein [Corynebacterium sp. SY003]